MERLKEALFSFSQNHHGHFVLSIKHRHGRRSWSNSEVMYASGFEYVLLQMSMLYSVNDERDLKSISGGIDMLYPLSGRITTAL